MAGHACRTSIQLRNLQRSCLWPMSSTKIDEFHSLNKGWALVGAPKIGSSYITNRNSEETNTHTNKIRHTPKKNTVTKKNDGNLSLIFGTFKCTPASIRHLLKPIGPTVSRLQPISAKWCHIGCCGTVSRFLHVLQLTDIHYGIFISGIFISNHQVD